MDSRACLFADLGTVDFYLDDTLFDVCLISGSGSLPILHKVNGGLYGNPQFIEMDSTKTVACTYTTLPAGCCTVSTDE